MLWEPQIDLGKDLGSSQAYWIAYIQGAFQGKKAEDNDPAAESGTLGETAAANVSLIYLESNLDVANEKGFDPVMLERETVVHEIGHQFSGVTINWHDSDGVLRQELGNGPVDFFGEESKLRLRTSTTVNE